MSQIGHLDTEDGKSLAIEDIRARLCLFAVLPNLSDVLRLDGEMAELDRAADVSVEVVVPGLPSLFIELAGGRCMTRLGSLPSGGKPDAILAFASAGDFNRTFLSRGAAFPERGLDAQGCFPPELARLRDRLVTYLERGDDTPEDPGCLAVRVQIKLQVAAFAVPVLLECDSRARLFRSALGNRSILLQVMPDGPSVGLRLQPDGVLPVREQIADPGAALLMRDLRVANAFLDRRLDSHVAVAQGDIETWGQIPSLDALNMVLDRVPDYL